MKRTFSETLSALRRELNISQRKAAADLNVSQALLSHYEKGVREPGLAFVCRACDYYNVSADYLLCRVDSRDERASAVRAANAFLEEMRAVTDKAQIALNEFAGKGTNK